MLNQHSHTVIPETDHLRIGDCILDVPRREILTPNASAPMRITLKSLQVLLVLVAHQGKVVSREALLEWVWADTMPTDDVLTQAITQLRKAFGDDRGAPRYVETIAKGGYRLLAPIEWVQPPAGTPAVRPEPALVPAVAASPVATRPSRRIVARGLIAAGMLLALAGLGYQLQKDRRAAPVASATTRTPAVAPAAATQAAQLPYQRITSLPGSELWPSLSPDGSQVVYSLYAGPNSASLMVQTTAPVPGHALTPATPGVEDTMPVWSPNGREIAFTRIGPKEACSLLLIPAVGGDARKVSDCRPGWMGGFNWHPDGKRLVTSQTGTAPRLDGAIYTIDLASGAWSRLEYEKEPRDTDLLPVYSPDGRWIAFHRNVSVSDVWRVPAQGGTPQRLTDLGTNINSIAWAPDGKSIVFGTYLDATLSLARLDLATLKVSDLGLPNTADASIALNAPSMAFVTVEGQSALYALDMNASDGASAKQDAPVFPSTGIDLLPAVAPDGEQIAFVSNRSASVGIWWARPGRPESLRLIDGVIPVPRYAPAWSADSTRMLVVGRSDNDKGLYELTPESGRVQHLPVPAGDPVHAEYVPGSSRILLVANRGAGRLELTLYDRGSTPWSVIARMDDVAMTRVDMARNRILIMRASEPGLWQSDLQLQHLKRINDRPAFGGGRRLVVTGRGLWLATTEPGCGLRVVELFDGGERPGRCLHAGPLNLTGVSLDATHQRLYFSSEREGNADVAWVRLPPLRAR